MAKKNDNLLKEAIADAKVVRETALANARAALEEAFMPHLTSMLSAKLKNEAEGYEEDEVHESDDNPMNHDASGDADHSEDGHGVDDHGATDDSIEEENDETSDIGAGGVATSNPGPKEPSAASSATSHITNDKDLVGTHIDEGEDEEDADLDAVIKELEADMEIDDLDEDDAMGHDASGDAVDSDDGFGDDEGGATVPDTHTGLSEDDDEELDLDIEDDEIEGDEESLDLSDYEGEDEDEVDLEEILREAEAELEKEKHSEKDHEMKESLVKENKTLKKQLTEHRQAVKFLRDKLSEVNLLNAKLLFTNKLFKGYDMNVQQKVRVVESFDRASTLREVKLVYATIAESFNRPAPKKNVAAKRIAEGLASKPVQSTKPASDTKILSEGSDIASRFQKLANIKKPTK